MTLGDVAPGDAFTVRTVRTGGEIGKRLADMGFTEGVQGTVIRGALLRGPVQVRIRGYDLLIRRSEAAVIDVATPSGMGRGVRPRSCCESGSAAPSTFSGHQDRGYGWKRLSSLIAGVLGMHGQQPARGGSRGQGDRAGSGGGRSHGRHGRNRDERVQRGTRS
jgi:ferrous iron transport protein A